MIFCYASTITLLIWICKKSVVKSKYTTEVLSLMNLNFKKKRNGREKQKIKRKKMKGDYRKTSFVYVFCSNFLSKLQMHHVL